MLVRFKHTQNTKTHTHSRFGIHTKHNVAHTFFFLNKKKFWFLVVSLLLNKIKKKELLAMECHTTHLHTDKMLHKKKKKHAWPITRLVDFLNFISKNGTQVAQKHYVNSLF